MKNIPKIKVKNSGIVQLQSFPGFRFGDLVIGESGKNIPFTTKRFFWINNFSNKKSIRGEHAHKKNEQIIFCLNGSFDLYLDDGKSKQNIKIKSSDWGIRIGKMLWHSLNNISRDCVILVVASDLYKESDYIRNYENFIQRF